MLNSATAATVAPTIISKSSVSKFATKEPAHMFILRALEKISAEKEVRKNNPQLKKACDAALEDIKTCISKEELSSTNASPVPTPRISGTAPSTVDAERYLVPFELACGTKSSRVIVTALDCIQKLIAYGHLSGNGPDPTNPKRRVIDRLVDTICYCFQGPQTDEDVQLQVIKALLTIATSPQCQVHERTLLEAVRTCYNIYMASRSLVNQKTARATLTQMLNVIFRRMEDYVPPGDLGGRSISGTSLASTPLPQQGQTAGSQQNSSPPQQQQQSGTESSTPAEPVAISIASDSRTLSENEDVVSANGDSGEGGSSSEAICSGIISDIVNSAVDQVVADQGGIVVLPPPASPTSSEATTSTLNDNNSTASPPNSAHQNGSALGSTSTPPGDANANPTDPGQPGVGDAIFPNIYQKDALMVFHSLCKLSMKTLTPPSGAGSSSSTSQDSLSYELRSKLLSLELILSILQNAGPVFRSSPVFISAVRQYLCVALSKNGVSGDPEVFERSLAIFLLLLENFKVHLKMQIEVFFKDIFLYILESPTSSFEHKWKVIHALTKICADAQCVVDLFLNYDCDLSLANVFERLVIDLAKVAQGRLAIELGCKPEQERAMRKKGLECIVSILKCMVEWTKELYVNPHQLSNLGTEHQLNEVQSDSQLTGSGSERGSKALFDDPQTFESMKQQKGIMELGVDLFNKNPKKGVKYFQEHKFVGTTATEIAEFFHKEDRLDRTAVGDYLGDANPFCIDVMWTFIDQMDFSGMDFVPALRKFLDGFRLPGEAQKIDRLMEKFAGRYCSCNPGQNLFASADTAYVLAFSIIMLTTDLHSPQIKNHMTKEQYIKMNRGINDAKDLPSEYLSVIFDEISEHEIKMKPTSMTLKPVSSTAQMMKSGALANERQRREMFNTQSEQMAHTAKALMESVSHVTASFLSASHYDHVRPMFKVVWTPFLAAFSIGLQDSDDEELAAFCLEGIRYAIRIACIFQLETERDAFMQALSRFTLLTASAPASEMKAKNIDTIKTLISVAQTDGNYLGKSWLDILRCISQLELAQLIGNGVKPSSAIEIKHASHHQQIMIGQQKTASGIGQEALMSLSTKTTNLAERQRLQEAFGETSSQSIVVAVDRIFTGSVKLDGNAIVEFVRALVTVSNEELLSPSHPRMFSLQKIVEISYYNMGRIRLQWSRIWEVLSEHFNRVSCSPNEDIAVFAVDSLRQLSMKFIEKGELANFRFQKEFLRPFEHIMKKNRSPLIRDLVVRCMNQMVASQARNIRSGWKNIFAVFQIAAGDNDVALIEMAFDTSKRIIVEVFPLHLSSIVDAFQDAVKCLSEFACSSQFQDVSLDAIRLIRLCADAVAAKPNLFGEHGGEEVANIPEEDRVWVRGWFPILFELTCIITRCKLDVRTSALTVFFAILKSYGNMLLPHWWHDLFQVILRLFDTFKLSEDFHEKFEWLSTTCNHALYAIVDVFTEYFSVLRDVVFNDVLQQLIWCIQQDSDQLARSSVNCFESLVLQNGPAFSANEWTNVCRCVVSMFNATTPDAALAAIKVDEAMHALNENSLVNSPHDRKSSITRARRTTSITRLSPETAIIGDLVDPRCWSEEDNRYWPLVVRAVAHLELIRTVESFLIPRRQTHEQFDQDPDHAGQFDAQVIYSSLGSNELFVICDSLFTSHTSARKFNTNITLRIELWRLGYGARQRPALIRQEVDSLHTLARILFFMYTSETTQQHRKTLGERLPERINQLTVATFQAFAKLEDEILRDSYSPVITCLLENLTRLDEAAFKAHMAQLYVPIVDVLGTTGDLRVDIRRALRDMLKRAATVFNISPAK